MQTLETKNQDLHFLCSFEHKNINKALEFGEKFIQQQIAEVYNLPLLLPNEMKECSLDVKMLNITYKKGL